MKPVKGTPGLPRNSRVANVRNRNRVTAGKSDQLPRRRKKPPVPKGLTSAEIAELDPEDPRFRHPAGRKRRVHDEENARDAIRAAAQRKVRARRAAARKAEALTVKRMEELPPRAKQLTQKVKRAGGTLEDQMIVEGYVDLEDWDDEELAMGYRRRRDGKFGKPPAFIPREVLQEAWRRLVNRGDMTMRKNFVKIIENQVKLALNADSEKVQMEAGKHLLERMVGKVPDKLLTVSTDAPWEAILYDSVLPMGQLPAGSEVTVGPVDALAGFDSGAAPDDEPVPTDVDAPGPTTSRAVAASAAAEPPRTSPNGEMPLEADDYW